MGHLLKAIEGLERENRNLRESINSGQEVRLLQSKLWDSFKKIESLEKSKIELMERILTLTEKIFQLTHKKINRLKWKDCGGDLNFTSTLPISPKNYGAWPMDSDRRRTGSFKEPPVIDTIIDGNVRRDYLNDNASDARRKPDAVKVIRELEKFKEGNND